MLIGVPKEIKDNEYRVALTPGGARQLTEAGHQVLVEEGAGEGSGFANQEYHASGARLASSADEVWSTADLVVKVKEPQPNEYRFLREDLILFTYLHLAADERLTKAMVESEVTGLAYETVELPNGQLPLLTPMSEVAGRMAVQVGAHYLEKMSGGRGKLLGGIPGVRPADVVIVGGGIVGSNAAQIALGMGAHVTIIDRDLDRLRRLSEVLRGSLTTLSSNPLNIANSVRHADLVIGAVLIRGGKAPQLVTKAMVGTMKEGSVIIDVAVDQGGCIETTRPTTHSRPTYQVNGVIHYCVSNMPAAVPRTSTYGLSNATLPYLVKLAASGLQALRDDPGLARGLNTFRGHITYPAVAEAFALPHKPIDVFLS